MPGNVNVEVVYRGRVSHGKELCHMFSFWRKKLPTIVPLCCYVIFAER